MEIPLRRRTDDASDGGITHAARHDNVDKRLVSLENRDLYLAALLAINTMLTAGDLVTKIGPIVKTFSAAIVGLRW